jgi:peptidyl-prolyl cis-trans isomerase B (cyclophilin B)
LFLAFATAAAGQDPASLVDPAGAVRARLDAVAGTVPAGAPIALELTLEVDRDCTVDATLLAGATLHAAVGEQKLKSFDKRFEGRTKLLAGTKLSRPIAVDAREIFGGDPPQDVVRLTLAWPGLPGADAVVVLTPDHSKLDVDKLDLTKTRVRLVTNYGDMVVSFRPDKAPKHVASFVKLAKDGFYDGTRFHRVITGFMIQGGCPNTKKGATGLPGMGGPGYKLDAEFSDLKHVKGVLSMARNGRDVNSAGSQFFVMHGERPDLDNKYTIFGKLEEGVQTLDTIAAVRVRPDAYGEPSQPVEPVHLHAAVVLPVFKE